MNSKIYGTVCFISVLLILSILQVAPDLAIADDHKTNKKNYKRYENSKERHDYDDHNRRQVKKDDEGNETTGQTASWLLAAANLTVAFSILIKGASRFLPLDPQTKSSFKSFNRFQKKHLMRFHYVLNPVALCIAFFHFLLSYCRSSPLPEWGLILVTGMVFLGLILKFKVSPKGMRKFVYRLHTTSVTSLIMILLLV
ncbi:MAG: hypothetical protein H8D96_00060, partial [Desulfobacterales bacterium]|nr:hypothetical protein [Candidatus Desulfatibia vada]